MKVTVIVGKFVYESEIDASTGDHMYVHVDLTAVLAANQGVTCPKT